MPETLLPALPVVAGESSWSEDERLAFWDAAARRLSWSEQWHTIHSSTGVDQVARRGPELRWFEGGKLNAAYNCVDRHVEAGRGDKVALHFEGEPGDRTTVTYKDLQDRVSQAANALLALGIAKGDRVVIYLPVIVETIVITLACARIGAVHSLVFGGFSAEALKFRVEDTGAKLLVTTDGQFRRGTAVPVKAQRRRGRRRRERHRARAGRPPHRAHRHRLDRGPGRVVARDGRHREHRTHAPRPSTPRPRCSSCTPPAPPASPRAWSTPPAAT